SLLELSLAHVGCIYEVQFMRSVHTLKQFTEPEALRVRCHRLLDLTWNTCPLALSFRDRKPSNTFRLNLASTPCRVLYPYSSRRALSRTRKGRRSGTHFRIVRTGA